MAVEGLARAQSRLHAIIAPMPARWLFLLGGPNMAVHACTALRISSVCTLLYGTVHTEEIRALCLPTGVYALLRRRR